MQAATTSDRDYWAAFTLDGEDGGFAPDMASLAACGADEQSNRTFPIGRGPWTEYRAPPWAPSCGIAATRASWRAWRAAPGCWRSSASTSRAPAATTPAPGSPT